MSRLVKILPRPTVQLYETASWWATNRSVVQASQWLAEIETAIQGLADTAPRHPLAREADAFDFPFHGRHSTKRVHVFPWESGPKIENLKTRTCIVFPMLVSSCNRDNFRIR